MYNHCLQCKDNIIPKCNNNVDIETKNNWKEWKIAKKDLKKVQESLKKIECEKNEVFGAIREIQDSFQKDPKVFKKHAFNIKAQNKTFRDCKENLKSGEASLLIFQKTVVANYEEKCHIFILVPYLIK